MQRSVLLAQVVRVNRVMRFVRVISVMRFVRVISVSIFSLFTSTLSQKPDAEHKAAPLCVSVFIVCMYVFVCVCVYGDVCGCIFVFVLCMCVWLYVNELRGGLA